MANCIEMDNKIFNWVSVDEKLPDKPGRYRVAVINIIVESEFKPDLTWDVETYDTVTHWCEIEQ